MELWGGLVLWNSGFLFTEFKIEGSYVRCNGLVLVSWCKEMLIDHVAYFERKAEEWERHGNNGRKFRHNGPRLGDTPG